MRPPAPQFQIRTCNVGSEEVRALFDSKQLSRGGIERLRRKPMNYRTKEERKMSPTDRERQLRDLWSTKPGQNRVLHLLWSIRPDHRPLQAGENVFRVIVEHEFAETASGAE